MTGPTPSCPACGGASNVCGLACGVCGGGWHWQEVGDVLGPDGVVQAVIWATQAVAGHPLHQPAHDAATTRHCPLCDGPLVDDSDQMPHATYRTAAGVILQRDQIPLQHCDRCQTSVLALDSQVTLGRERPATARR